MLFNRDCDCGRQMGTPMAMPGMNMPGCCNPCCNPCCGDQVCYVTDPAINKCIEREFMHEIKHIQPIHTHIINRNIYTHTFVPQYSCSEECQVVDMGCGCGRMPNF